MASSKQIKLNVTNLMTLAITTGVYAKYSIKSRQWFRSNAQLLNTSGAQFMKEAASPTTDLKTKFSNQIYIGNLHFYQYDPKLKQKLPYYDIYPVVFPIQKYKDGFLGINLHYLPPVLRAKLMDVLYAKISDKNYDFNTKLKISYNILNSASRYKWFRPCIKRYLYKHIVGGRTLRVAPKEWELVGFLPLAKFRKQPKEVVWNESRQKINAR